MSVSGAAKSLDGLQDWAAGVITSWIFAWSS
jgi:hypothetical protein